MIIITLSEHGVLPRTRAAYFSRRDRVGGLFSRFYFFQVSHFPPVPAHSNQYTQSRASPGRVDYQSYNNQWQPNNNPMTAPQPAFGYYDDARYSAQPAYPAMYAPRSATVAPAHQSDPRRLPPLSTTPAPERDERWASSYPAPAFNVSPNTHIRSPTASYPASYTTTYPPANPYGYYHVNDPRLSALSPQLMANDQRAVSPYGRGSSHVSPPTPPPVSPIGSDESAAKKKRKFGTAPSHLLPHVSHFSTGDDGAVSGDILNTVKTNPTSLERSTRITLYGGRGGNGGDAGGTGGNGGAGQGNHVQIHLPEGGEITLNIHYVPGGRDRDFDFVWDMAACLTWFGFSALALVCLHHLGWFDIEGLPPSVATASTSSAA
ncbi:hypothetical protein C8R44DRAFT_768203 [Mycena epipterygia]|nr:hypothetical protein C8R44DRAFT_768203 [Mycena epipterygia]